MHVKGALPFADSNSAMGVWSIVDRVKLEQKIPYNQNKERTVPGIL